MAAEPADMTGSQHSEASDTPRTPKWSEAQTSAICGMGEEEGLKGKGVKILDQDQYTSVRQAVDALNGEEGLCSEGICLVYSQRTEKYVMLYRADMRSAAFQRFGLTTDGNSIVSLIANGLASWFEYTPRPAPFCNSRLIMTCTGHLTERYDCLRELGQGVGGILRLLRRKETDQEYVAKEAKGGLRYAAHSIRAECDMMRAMRHPNCVKMVEYFNEDQEGFNLWKKGFIVCDFAPGGDLGKYMEAAAAQGGAAEVQLSGILHHVLRGVAFLHASGCVHNDLKPANMLVMEEFRKQSVPWVLITDYGCAARTDKARPVTFGDPRYMAPENLRLLQQYEVSGTKSVCLSPACDVWSIGVTLYELCSNGVLPFLYEHCPHLTRPVVDRLKKVLLDDDVPAVLDVPTDWPNIDSGQGLPELLRQLLASEPERRPQVCEALKHPWASLGLAWDSHLATLTVHPDRICQILLNAVMWRLPLQHCKEQRCHDTFRRMDEMRCGRISREVFLKVLRQFKASSEEDIFTMADVDCDGMLEFNEFAAISYHWPSLGDKDLIGRLQELLDDLGADSSGSVARTDLERFFGDAFKAEAPMSEIRFVSRPDEAGRCRLEHKAVEEFLKRFEAGALPTIRVELLMQHRPPLSGQDEAREWC